VREKFGECLVVRSSYPRSRWSWASASDPGVIRVILSSTFACDEPVDERLAVGLVVVPGVVALAEEHGHEVRASLDVGAGLTRRLHPAFELDGSRAQPVAEHAGVRFATQSFHGSGLDLGGQRSRVAAALWSASI
jgi:hypothetical protein